MPSSATNGDASTHTGFVVGEWTVTPSRNLLVRGAEEVRVEPRVMDVLVLLAGRPDQLVSKEDLIEQVWKTRYVTDDVLTVAIYGLRKTLGDDARRPRYVETVSRRGYRLIAQVQPLTQTSVLVPAERPMPAPARRWRQYSWPTLATGLVTVALLATAAMWTFTAASHRGRHVAPIEAHEAYLKGRHFLDQRSIQGWQQALEQFERAVALDPRDPAAQAGLADSYT